jgi:hypothetical protein
MTQRIDIDCSTGQPRTVVLTAAEQSDFDGRVVGGTAAEATRIASAANADMLRQRAQAAITQNAAFLALTVAQQATQGPAQLILLTKECTTLIRLLLSQLDSTAGT